MDKCFFLIVADRHSPIFNHITPAYDFFRSFFCSTQSNSVIYIIVPNLATLRQVRDEFPGAHCILLDIDKSVETVKSLLVVLLPEIEVMIDFTGKLGTQILRWVPARKPKATIELKTKRLNLIELNNIWYANNSWMPILINVLPPKEGQNLVKDAAQAVKKKGEKLIDALKSENGKWKPIRFKPGPRFSPSVTTVAPSGSRRSASLSRGENSQSDRAPLLGRQNDTEDSDQVEITLSSFISWVWSNCCCCLSILLPTPLPTPQFTSEGQLRSYIRGQQHDYTCRKLDTIFAEGEQNLVRFLHGTNSEEEARIRDKYEAIKKDATAKYLEVCTKNKENPSTVDLIQKGQASRERIALDNIKRADTDLAKELGDLKKRWDAERGLQGEADHYEKVVQAELDLGRRAKLKFEELYDQLYAQNEANWVLT